MNYDRRRAFSRATLIVVCPAICGMMCVSPAKTMAASTTNEVVAIVNGFLISDYDLEQRIGLFTVLSGMPVTPETRPQIRAQVLKAFEDEVLEMQEAAKHRTAVTKDDVAKALQALADDKHVTPEQLVATMMAADVKAEILGVYLSDQLIWRKLVATRYGADAAGEADLNQAMANYLNDLRTEGVVETR